MEWTDSRTRSVLLRLVDVDVVEKFERISTESRSSTACSAAGSCPPRSCSSAASRASASRPCRSPPLGAVSETRRALLVTGEESVAQVKLRADRLGGCDQVEILAETELDAVCATLERERPAVCVIDSVQTLYSADIGSAPGSVAQVREAAGRLLRVAKEAGVATPSWSGT